MREASDGILSLVRAPFTGGRSVIYRPRPYKDRVAPTAALENVERIEYQSKGKLQTAYIHATPLCTPEKIWVFFAGNGMLALEWLSEISTFPPSTGPHVLFEYPGYGHSEGRPSSTSIRHAVDDFLLVLAKRFDLSRCEIRARLGVVGFSLGAAIAMETAARHGVRHVMLIAPFTTIKAVAVHQTGRLLGEIVREDFDNIASIRAWCELWFTGERISIVHGTNDECFPISMSEELADKFADCVELKRIEGASHNGLWPVLPQMIVSKIRASGEAAKEGADENVGGDCSVQFTGDLDTIVFVHGFNNSVSQVQERFESLQRRFVDGRVVLASWKSVAGDAQEKSGTRPMESFASMLYPVDNKRTRGMNSDSVIQIAGCLSQLGDGYLGLMAHSRGCHVAVEWLCCNLSEWSRVRRIALMHPDVNVETFEKLLSFNFDQDKIAVFDTDCDIATSTSGAFGRSKALSQSQRIEHGSRNIGPLAGLHVRKRKSASHCYWLDDEEANKQVLEWVRSGSVAQFDPNSIIGSK